MFRRNYTNHIAMSIIICVAIPAIILFGIMQLDQNAFTKYHISQVATEQLLDKMSDIQGWLSDKSSSVDQYGAAMESYIKVTDSMIIHQTSYLSSLMQVEILHIYM